VDNKDFETQISSDVMDFETMQLRRIEDMKSLLEEKKMKQLQALMEETDEFDVAQFLSELPHSRMAMVFRLLSKEHAAEVFAELELPEQEYIINSITDTELAAIIEELYVDDAVDIMEELPANVVKRVMRAATSETRALINQYLKYPEYSAGSIMTAEFIDLKKYMNVREAFARIKRIGADKETIYTLFVTSTDRKLEGIVSIKDLIMADENDIIENLMDDKVVFATTTDDQEYVSSIFSDYDLIAIPVVDKEHRLVGIVTVDDVIDVMEQEATEDIEIMAAITPTDKPYLRMSTIALWKSRIPWLLILMISATFTGLVLNSFEEALATYAVLIGFIPMLMDTGGNSGSQASVTVIRSISLGDIELSDVFKIVWKEARVAVLCAITLAVACFVKILLVDKLLFGNDDISIAVAAVVCFTVALTVICAKVVGCTMPLLAKRIGFDPAVMASPFITTIVDVVSLLIYFAIAKVLLGF